MAATAASAACPPATAPFDPATPSRMPIASTSPMPPAARRASATRSRPARVRASRGRTAVQVLAHPRCAAVCGSVVARTVNAVPSRAIATPGTAMRSTVADPRSAATPAAPTTIVQSGLVSATFATDAARDTVFASSRCADSRSVQVRTGTVRAGDDLTPRGVSRSDGWASTAAACSASSASSPPR